MTFLGKKDEEKISRELREMINSKLLNDFKDRRGRPVIKVDSIKLVDKKIHEDNSDRDKIVFSTIQAICQVWVKNDESGGSSNDNFHLRNTNPIILVFDNDLKEYKIENKDQIVLINITPF